MARTPSLPSLDQPSATVDRLPRSVAVAMFVAFASAYFLSNAMRGVTATLAPTFTLEFGLSSSQLGLLAGAYFLGFALMQLPLGHWLDRHGPKRVLLVFLAVASLSSIAFATALNAGWLWTARAMGGVGVSACLMAPLTAYRRWLDPSLQQRANAWMLMVGAMGLLAATVPVQWALPRVGWRGVFWIIAACFAASIALIAWQVPASPAAASTRAASSPRLSLWAAYAPILAHPTFRRLAPVGFFCNGAVTAVQTLWAGPWLTQVTGLSAQQSARGLFGINLTMLIVFWAWGAVNPRLARAGLAAETMLAWGLPIGIGALGLLAWLGPQAGWAVIAAFCALSSTQALAQPAVGMAVPLEQAGRALSAFNLMLFLGVFSLQWCIGAGIDALQAAGWGRVDAFRGVFASVAVCSALAYLWFIAHRPTGKPA